MNERANWTILGVPANRRVALFQEALARRGAPPAQVVPYRELLRDRRALARALGNFSGAQRLRIESPGEDHEVERQLIALGAQRRGSDSILPEAARRLRRSPGRIRHVRQWFLGFSALLEDVQQSLLAFPEVVVQNAPDSIRLLFDKPRCHALLTSRGIATPPALPGVSDYDSLRDAMRDAGWDRVFVKLAFGSSGSGVVAFSMAHTSPVAITTVELTRRGAETRCYNNLRLSTYRSERDLRDLFAFLCREGAHVERWLPKAHQDGRNFDLRVVTIGGRARHMVVRASRSPLTNLHLGNRRGDQEAARAAAGPRWSGILELCERAAAVVPDAHYVGWDVLVTPGFRRAYILEGNAFGDLLPNVLCDGLSTYDELAAFANERRIPTP